MLDRERIAGRIAYFRKKRGFSQAALAESLGVSAQAASKWERAQALPDVETLIEMAHLFDAPLEALLCDDTAEARRPRAESVEAELPPAARRLLGRAARYFGEGELEALAALLRGERAPLNVTVRAEIAGRASEVCLEPDELTDGALDELAPAIVDAFATLMDRPDAGLRAIAGRMACPECGARIAAGYKEARACLKCEIGHAYALPGGVADFGGREIKGELWSLWLKDYEQYRAVRVPENINPNYLRGADQAELFWREIEAFKPRAILDVASGMGSGVEMYAPRISWPCVIVLTDISHRILKYDREWFAANIPNPNVRFAYVSCDCAKLPFQDASFDAVTSFGGFESMQDKFMSGFDEARRVLKPGGRAVYSMGIAGGDANTRKWLDIIAGASDPDARECVVQTLDQWRAKCSRAGYARTEANIVYDELPAPDSGDFPFENEIMQWLGEYVCVSYK